MTQRRPSPGAPAFTIIELLVVMAVIIILAGLLLGAVMHARHQARDANCRNNLSQMWRAINIYVAQSDSKPLFTNEFPPLKVSNVTYKDQTVTGLGHLYTHPEFLPDHRSYYCPDDPVRDPRWQYGWEENWAVEDGEVQCSYGYRGRHGIIDDPKTDLTLAVLESSPSRVLICDYYETFTAPKRIHHSGHINALRCNGQVEAIDQTTGHVSFGPADEDFERALQALDR